MAPTTRQATKFLNSKRQTRSSPGESFEYWHQRSQDNETNSRKSKAKKSKSTRSAGRREVPGRTPSASPPHSPRRSPRTQTPPHDPSLEKRDGTQVSNGDIINPRGVRDGRVIKRWPAVQSTHSRGLRNRRIDCYRNAVVQALIHVPAIYRLLGEIHRDCKTPLSKCVVCAFQKLTDIYWNDTGLIDNLQGPVFSTLMFHRACDASPPAELLNLREDFETGLQGDGFDFVQYLVNRLRDQALPTDAIQHSDIFDLPLEARWICGDCGEPKDLNESSRGVGLSVSMHGTESNKSLVERLRHDMEIIQNRRCEKDTCKDKFQYGDEGQSGTTVYRITQLPQVLVIQLSIFTHKKVDGKWMSHKVTERAPYGEYLNLGPWANDGEDHIYRLDGVVGHQGTLDRGHYVAAVRKHDGTGFEIIDDNNAIAATRIEDMTKLRSMGLMFEPYIFVYSKM